MQADSQPRPSQPTLQRRNPFVIFVDWAAENAVPALTLLGLIAYGGLRLAFGSFYGRFGVTPEEVGYDYVTVLATTLPGIVALLAILAFALLLGHLALRKLTRQRGPRWSTRAFNLGGAILALYAVIGLGWVIILESTRNALGAKNGVPVRGLEVFGLPVTPWRVEPAQVTPVTRDARTSLTGLSATCLMYLGQSGTSYVLYDVANNAAIRVPVAAVSIRVGQSARGCRP